VFRGSRGPGKGRIENSRTTLREGKEAVDRKASNIARRGLIGIAMARKERPRVAPLLTWSV
jgi:hypothetical protein